MSEFSVDPVIFNKAPFLDTSEGFSDRSFLQATLQAIKMYVFKTLGVVCEYSFSDYVKQQWKVEKKVAYPRAYISMTALEVQQDRGNNRALRTAGIPAKAVAVNDATSNYIKSAKIFPVKITLELHYFESDMSRLLAIAETLAVLSAMNAIVIPITVQEAFEFQAKCDLDPNIALPQIEHSNDSDPGSGEVTVTLTVSSYIGKIEDVARAYDLTSSKERSNANINV